MAKSISLKNFFQIAPTGNDARIGQVESDKDETGVLSPE